MQTIAILYWETLQIQQCYLQGSMDRQHASFQGRRRYLKDQEKYLGAPRNIPRFAHHPPSRPENIEFSSCSDRNTHSRILHLPPKSHSDSTWLIVAVDSPPVVATVDVVVTVAVAVAAEDPGAAAQRARRRNGSQ